MLAQQHLFSPHLGRMPGWTSLPGSHWRRWTPSWWKLFHHGVEHMAHFSMAMLLSHPNPWWTVGLGALDGQVVAHVFGLQLGGRLGSLAPLLHGTHGLLVLDLLHGGLHMVLLVVHWWPSWCHCSPSWPAWSAWCPAWSSWWQAWQKAWQSRCWKSRWVLDSKLGKLKWLIMEKSFKATGAGSLQADIKNKAHGADLFKAHWGWVWETFKALGLWSCTWKWKTTS